MGTAGHATAAAMQAADSCHAPGRGPAGVLPPWKAFQAAVVEVEARRRTDRTVTPRPVASACEGPPCRGARRDAAPDPEVPTSAAAAGREPGTAEGKGTVAAGGRGAGTVAGEEATVGDRTGRGAAGEAEAGRRGSGARNSQGRCRRRRGSAMDGPCGAQAGRAVLRDLGFWRDRRDETEVLSFQNVREAFRPKKVCGAQLQRGGRRAEAPLSAS
jgi:hypothetical protein